MNFQEQQQQFNELKNRFEQLNAQFDQTMKKANLSKEDLQIDESTLSEEVRHVWEKTKNDIQNTAKAVSGQNTVQHNTKAGAGRRNAIRL